MLRGIDDNKDQTYFLWRLPQSVLRRTIFPLGELTKPEVRQIAFDAGYEKLSKKAESQEICFVPDNDYREFLRAESSAYNEIGTDGNFVDVAGNILGRHKGYPNYTVGQRKGLGIALGRPMFVSQIRPERNEVVLADRDDRIRYKSPATSAKIVLEGNKVRVSFDKEVWAVAAGQSVVFYKDNLIIGGGVIE